MKISYNWLSQYLELPAPGDLEQILVNLGLEVEAVEPIEQVKGGMEGLVVGLVLSCERHPNADKLSLTQVDVGGEVPLRIVCGAPNVRAGQKVVVATIGTTLWKGEESFRIQKSKIRGEVSEGMICAEDEIGLGQSHDGIMVLAPEAQPGTPARSYFQLETDFLFEIGLTPNRIDAASHLGVARDIRAFLGRNGVEIPLRRPSIEAFPASGVNLPVEVEVQEPEGCIRYSGLTLTGLKVAESPNWLKQALVAIGLKPINNVVDVTNYVLHETGQPLHAFDLKEVTGRKIVVRTCSPGQVFTTLDGVERRLHEQDLMICNAEAPMCIAGVFGGLNSGVTESTDSIFLESATFSPVWVRKTARRHGLNTDSSFRFERGSDPEIPVYALKRAALLILEVAGGQLAGPVVDWYPKPVEWVPVSLSWERFFRLLGADLDKELVKRILSLLDIRILHENLSGLELSIPPYRVDVTREADVAEEVLRVYGYNEIPIPGQIRSSLIHFKHPDPVRLVELSSEYLVSNGFSEIMSNSLTRLSYYQDLQTFPASSCALILNPLSSDLNALRQTLFFGMAEAARHNLNRQNPDLKLFEFGTCYQSGVQGPWQTRVGSYSEFQELAVFMCGHKAPPTWIQKDQPIDFFSLKGYVGGLLARIGIQFGELTVLTFQDDLVESGLDYQFQGLSVLRLGCVARSWRKRFDLPDGSFYASMNWSWILARVAGNKVAFKELPRFPEVRRDLALVLDKAVEFAVIRDIAFRTERKLLKDLFLFDVFEGEKIGPGKKSYAVGFILRDEDTTLTDRQIEKAMANLLKAFEQEAGASLRN